MVVHQSKILAV